MRRRTRNLLPRPFSRSRLLTSSVLAAAAAWVLCRIFGVDGVHTLALTVAAFILGICNGLLDLLPGWVPKLERPAVPPRGASPVADMAFALTRRGSGIGLQGYAGFAHTAGVTVDQWRSRHAGEQPPAPCTLAALRNPAAGPDLTLTALASCLDELEYLNGSRTGAPILPGKGTSV